MIRLVLLLFMYSIPNQLVGKQAYCVTPLYRTAQAAAQADSQAYGIRPV